MGPIPEGVSEKLEECLARFAIVTSTGCCGFVLARRHEFEAFNAEEISLGLFKDEDAAEAAITKNITTNSIETSL